MFEFFGALATQQFLQHAVLAGVLAGIGCGVMGTYVVVKRIGYLAGGIAHAVLGGMGIAYFFGRDPIIGALIAALAAAVAVGWISRRGRQHVDTIIGALWAVGMAIGILFISQTPGYNVDLLSYLFGNILMVAPQDLWFIAILDLIIVLVVVLFYRQFLAVTFDEEFALLRGVPVGFFDLLLLSMVALTVVMLIRVVGLILVIALLTLPAAIAGQYVRSLGRMMVVAIGLGVAFAVGGLALSYGPDLPAGASIIVLAGVTYLLSTALQAGVRWRRMRSLQSHQAASPGADVPH
jgi:zinc transport system permease protein